MRYSQHVRKIPEPNLRSAVECKVELVLILVYLNKKVVPKVICDIGLITNVSTSCVEIVISGETGG